LDRKPFLLAAISNRIKCHGHSMPPQEAGQKYRGYGKGPDHNAGGGG
jgi:hypothetical protein